MDATLAMMTSADQAAAASSSPDKALAMDATLAMMTSADQAAAASSSPLNRSVIGAGRPSR